MNLAAWLFWGCLAAWNLSLTLFVIGHSHKIHLRAVGPPRSSTRLRGRG